MHSRPAVMALRALGILIAVALQTGWMLQPQVPLAVRVFQPGLLALSIADPASALLVLAGLGPIAVAICVATGTAVDGGRLFEQMTLALFTGFLIRWPRADDGTRLRLAGPALILAAIGVASAAAVQPALALAYDPHATVGDHLSALWHAKYYGRSPEWEPLFFAALGVEGAALGAVTERLCRARSTLCAAVLRMSIVGQAGAATSAVMSLFIQATRAPHVWQAFIHLYLTSRTSFETDVNTAGSTLVLVCLAAIGLWMTRQLSRIVAAPAAVLLASGLWTTGSRAALASLVIATVAVPIVASWGQRKRFMPTAIAIVVGLGLLGGILLPNLPAARSSTMAIAVQSRAVLTKTSLAMVRSAPVAGIGIGRYWDRSVEFGAAALIDVPGVATDHENAHNNFLQVFAEQGTIGLAALLWLLGGLATAAIREERRAPDPLRRWLLAGLTAYVLTWLAGHPLLVRQSACCFWMYCGLIASRTPALAWRRRWTLPWLVVAVLLISVPVRAERERRVVNLDHGGSGVSAWQHVDGATYRDAGAHFSLYLPSTAPAVIVPIRRANAAPDPLRVRIAVDGRLVSDLVVAGEEWTDANVRLIGQSRLFPRVDFTVSSTMAGGSLPRVLVHVAKDVIPGAPVITASPSNATIAAGSNATFTVAASDHPTPRYQWQGAIGGRGFTNLGNVAPYGNVTTATLTVLAATAMMNGVEFRAVVSNAFASAASAPATLTIRFAPTIALAPRNATANIGAQATFSVAATGNPAPTYQWQGSMIGAPFANLVNSASFNDVTSPTLMVAVTAGLHGSRYRAVATNGISSVTSNVATLSATVGPPRTPDRGDFTGDGKPDLIWQHADTGAVMLWGMNGPSHTSSTIVRPEATPWRVVGTGDFTGDGKPDLLLQHPRTGALVVWAMDGTHYVRSISIPNEGDPRWTVVAVGDFTGDGKPDIVWQHAVTGAVRLWEMRGLNIVNSTTVNADGTPWRVAGAADFTGDGKLDLLLQHPRTGALAVWAMDGPTYVKTIILNDGGTLWQVAAVGDYTGDGKPDIVWQHPTTNAVLLWEMDGTTYVSSSLLSSGPTPWRVKGPR